MTIWAYMKTSSSNKAATITGRLNSNLMGSYVATDDGSIISYDDQNQETLLLLTILNYYEKKKSDKLSPLSLFRDDITDDFAPDLDDFYPNSYTIPDDVVPGGGEGPGDDDVSYSLIVPAMKALLSETYGKEGRAVFVFEEINEANVWMELTAVPIHTIWQNVKLHISQVNPSYGSGLATLDDDYFDYTANRDDPINDV